MGQGKASERGRCKGEEQGEGYAGKECLICGSRWEGILPRTYTRVCVLCMLAQLQGRKHTRKCAKYAR